MKGIILDTLNMEVKVNLQRDASGMIVNGVTVGEINYQRAHLIVVLTKGEVKEYPGLGFGLKNWLKRTGNDLKQLFAQELTTELASDGIEGVRVELGDSMLNFKIEGL